MIDVELVDVTKRFGDVVAVNHVSFSVEKGEFFSLLGPSGCGKTTTLRIISGFEEPDEGEVYIKGESMKGVPPNKRPTNMVFQNLALFPHMNVYDNIAFGLKLKKLPKSEIDKKVKEVLELVHLPGYEKRWIKQLSGGEQQRVAIARALVNEPEVLLLDEPLGPLDLKLREEMIIELKRIQREVGTTFIYVTHDQGEALTMSDKIAVMNKGRVVQIGSPLELYERPNSPFVADFVGRSNLIRGKYIDGAVEVPGLGSISVEERKIPNNSEVWVCIKPERVTIGKKLSGLDNVFEGEIREVYYQGKMTMYKVIMPNGTVITVMATFKDTGTIFDYGEKVNVGWNVSDVWVIPQRGGE